LPFVLSLFVVRGSYAFYIKRFPFGLSVDLSSNLEATNTLVEQCLPNSIRKLFGGACLLFNIEAVSARIKTLDITPIVQASGIKKGNQLKQEVRLETDA
jgi:hypothetical protein